MWEELENLERTTALELARKLMVGADLRDPTPEQESILLWLEVAYLDGDITYREMWNIALGRDPSVPWG